jgi:HD superfamily phosphodiesterase
VDRLSRLRDLATSGDLLRRSARVLAPVATGVVFLVVLFAGGAPSPYLQLPYIPIILAAYGGGTRVGLAYGFACAVLFDPVLTLVDLEHNGEPFGLAWVVRGTMFTTVGLMLGWLFSRSRSVTAAWRETALEVTASHQEGMLALARAAEAKDPTTGDHMFRCGDLAGALAREADLEEPVVTDVAWSAMLHDIGKLYVPEHVLAKPGELSAEEWALIRTHPVRGAELLDHSRAFETARRIARWHHENLDGSGYPDGLRGDAIPLEARIVRVVDAWDAMTNDRPYRSALSVEQALEELRRWRGRAFDPELVELFARLVERDPSVALPRPATAGQRRILLPAR